MSRFVYKDNVKDYLESVINEDFATLTPEEMLTTLKKGVDNLASSPKEVGKIYTSRDIQEIREYLISMITDLTDDWTDFNESDIGIALLELLAGIADMQGFYLDRQALECYITDVKQRKNGMAILKLIGYNMHLTRSSVTTGRFAYTEYHEEGLVIPKFTQVSATLSDDSKIYFATTEEKVMAPSVWTIDIPLMEGEVHHSEVKVGDIRKNQKIRINTANVAEDTLTIKINGEEWERVDDVLVDDKPGPKFSVFEDKECFAYILFHNSYKEYLPVDDEIVAEIRFLKSSGKNGKIKAGMITKVESPIMIGDLDIANRIEVTNIEDSSGGSDRETLDEAREQAPKSLAMLDRAIILQDFQDMATGMQGVLKAKALDWSVPGDYVTAPFLIKLFIVPTDNYDISQEQCNQIIQYFETRKVNYQQVEVHQPEYITININAVVDAYVAEANKEFLEVKIVEKLKSELDPSKLDFGMDFYPGDIKSIIRSADDSIYSIDLMNPREEFHLRMNQFLRLGEVNLLIKTKDSR